MKITVSSGKYDVIENGSVIADAWESDIEFHLYVNPLGYITLILHFEEQKDSERKIEFEAKENKIKFTCINFEDTVGTSRPLELGVISGKKVYFNFRNYEEKKVMRKIEYTFYEEK